MKIIGHRGAKGLAPENTIAALKKGLEHHVDMLEFDVRVTKDHKVILNHAATVRSNDGHKLKVTDHSYKELKDIKPDLATFEEVLEQIGHQVVLYVEVKPDVSTKEVIKVIQSYLDKGWKPEYFRLSSFDLQVLLRLHEAFPAITITVLENWSGVRAALRARQLGTIHLIMNQRWLWSGFIRSMTKRGFKLGAYTLNDPAKAKRWEKAGLSAVVTDYPDRFEK